MKNTMTLEQWLNNNELAIDIWNRKYKFENETFEEWLDRVSGGNDDIRQLILEKKFLFGGRTLASRGLHKLGKKITYSNCYVLESPSDSIEGIFKVASEMARTFSYGGGVGIALDNLRPKGSKVNNSAEETTGAVSFMDLYSKVTDIIGQKGRRGALMLCLNIKHPDIEEFIDIKTDLNQVTKANISVKITDEFMEAVKNGEDFECRFVIDSTGEEIVKVVNAKELFHKLAKNNWDFAEPGILYWNQIEEWTPVSEYEEFKYSAPNPCLVGDTLIQTVEGEIPIKDLVGQQPYVYCMDEDEKLTIKQASKVWLTKRDAELVKIHHHRGTLICTPDHKIFTRNRGWVEAKDLKPKDKLKGLNRKMKNEQYCAVALSGDKKYTSEHRFIIGHFQEIKGKDVHHVNENTLDNRLSNLEVISHSKHSVLSNTGRSIEVIRDEKGRYIEKEIKKSKEAFEINSKQTGVNWIVREVEFLNYTEDVYDMTVPGVHNFVADGIIVHNCGEQPLPPYGSCNLGSINLAEFVKYPFTDKATFDIEEFIRVCQLVTIGMDEVLEEGKPLHPLKEQQEQVDNWNNLGIGIMGISDMLIKMGVRYGSEESLALCDAIGREMLNAIMQQSSRIACWKGTFPKFNRVKTLTSPFIQENCDDTTIEMIKLNGLRHAFYTTIAPTGTLSTMLGISGGIEPMFNLSYVRKTQSLHDEEVFYTVYTPIVEQYMKAKGIENEADLPDIFVTAMNLNPLERVDMQSTWQKYIDSAISSTVNLPNEATIEDVQDIYMYAWERGLKGITVYRSGCKREGILINASDMQTEEVSNELKRGDWREIADDTIYYKRKIKSGCGSLNLFLGYSPSEGTIQEMYMKRSGQGGCSKNIENTVIAMSGMLRLGGNLDNLKKAFNGIETCPSYIIAKKNGKEVSKGISCGSSILHEIDAFMSEIEEVNRPMVIKKETPKAVTPKVEKKAEMFDITHHTPNSCPECNAKLENVGGCYTCMDCGYSKCS